jgi:hypothetical protein
MRADATHQVHPQDIAIPLGRSLEMPTDVAVVDRAFQIGDARQRSPDPDPVPDLGNDLLGRAATHAPVLVGHPSHIKLLRDLCVERRRWLQPVEFEDGWAGLGWWCCSVRG